MYRPVPKRQTLTITQLYIKVVQDYPLFLSVLPVPVDAGVAVALEAGGFLVVADLSVLITVRFAGGGAAGLAALEAGLEAAALVAVVFFTTVAVLPSLASLVALTLRLPRVEAAVGGRDGAAACRVRVVVGGPILELAVDEVVVFLVPTAGRVPLAFSTMLDRIFCEALGGPLRGDAGLLIMLFVGDAGRSRGTIRVFDDVGDNIWPG